MIPQALIGGTQVYPKYFTSEVTLSSGSSAFETVLTFPLAANGVYHVDALIYERRSSADNPAQYHFRADGAGDLAGGRWYAQRSQDPNLTGVTGSGGMPALHGSVADGSALEVSVSNNTDTTGTRQFSAQLSLVFDAGASDRTLLLTMKRNISQSLTVKALALVRRIG